MMAGPEKGTALRFDLVTEMQQCRCSQGLCVNERERETETETDRQTDRVEGVCVCERERER